MFTISNYYIGVNIGSVSVNLVITDESGKVSISKKAHLGRPKEVLDELLEEHIQDKNNNYFYEISGSFGELSEIVAVERALSSYDEKFDVILSLGGEAIVLYVLDENEHILNVLSHDKCAAGSGEFFKQQIDRLGLSLKEAITLANKGKRIEISSRCSVHCKSDITHKLNRGEASVEDLLNSVLASMVNKVIGLIIQSRVDVKRVLAIGGVTLNPVFIKLLREELNDVEVVVKKESSVFEAYGTALIAKDNPNKEELELIASKSFATHPNLKDFSEKVTIIEAKEHKRDFEKNADFILGVDVGSTTTKAVLVDPKDYEVIASYYGRTSGNPVKATKKCIKEIIRQVGDQKIYLTGVTGSGRQLVGAYLGTSAVYNEISAHSEGAVFYDKDVDTIFEIGGQDSKYMYLQNEVPVDYAMNATCSAGTGSFLEESAKGDLGIEVYDISNVAINAPEPVRFKADCAAFINTDIRTALQEDYGRENIIGGLVYSIVDNYLNKVKGSREVGKKVFFQGGVAKNHSVGYAFAQATGKQIIIPPNPELMGAFGIALIAKKKYEQHEISGMADNVTLKELAKQELKHLGSFRCRACENYCQIERYEVGGRKFSFGGSCSKYEHQWRGTDKISEKEDLVAKRNDLIFSTERKTGLIRTLKSKGKIGIPRALLTHSLFPLYSTFLQELGYEVILSDIDEEKELMTNAPFCYPVQILHGAVLDLVKKNITTIFIPHVVNMTRNDDWFESTFCPITQASSYFISTAFRNTRILKPTLDFIDGYESETSLIHMAVHELYQPKRVAREAYRKAVAVQKEIEAKFIQMGEEAIKHLEETGELGVILVGRSYNAFPPETSLKIPKKLASMGVTVIPFDFLEKESVNNIPWYFANYVKVAIDLAMKKENLFLLYINSFSCTIDAFVQNYVRTEMDSKPYLILELDAHTADAGIQTRLEAFLEIIKNYQARKRLESLENFQMAKVKRREGKTVVITSEGNKVDIKDSRVKLYLPSFSKYHTDLGSGILKMMGFHMGETTDIKLEYPVKGLRCSSGKECIPLPIVLGQIQSIVEKREPGEISGIYMIRGGAPCAVFSYFHYLEQYIESNQLENVFIYRVDFPTKFLGMKLREVIRYLPRGFILGDIIHEIESALQVVGDEDGLEMLYRYWDEFLINIQDKKNFKKYINKLAKQIAKIPRKENPQNLPKVLISGDFFVRFSPFFLRELKEIYAKNGILVKSTDLFELGIYGNHFNGGYIILKEWKQNPDKFTTAMRATFTPWVRGSQLFLLSRTAIRLLIRMERRLRKRFDKTGLLFAQPNDLKKVLKLSDELISRLIFGEAIPTIGKGLETLEDSHFDSLILTGPFNCLPYKISQAILKPIYLDNNVPFLVFDADISSITPNEKRLIYANIQQIKRKVATVKEEPQWKGIIDRKERRWARKRARKERRLVRKANRRERRWNRREERKKRRWERIEYRKRLQWKTQSIRRKEKQE